MHRVTTRRLLGSAVLGSVLLASCSTGTESGSFEPDIASMTITVITQTGTVGTDYTATDAANGFGAAIALLGSSALISAVGQNNRAGVVHEFELDAAGA